MVGEARDARNVLGLDPLERLAEYATRAGIASRSERAHIVAELRGDDELRRALGAMPPEQWEGHFGELRASCHGYTRPLDTWRAAIVGAARRAALEARESRAIIDADPDHHVVMAAAEAALGRHPDIYRGPAGQPVQVVPHHEHGRPIMRDLGPDALRVELARCALLVDGEGRQVPWSGDHGRMLHASASWAGLRPLHGTAAEPILRPDGTVAQLDGYDVASGMLIALDGEYPPIPEAPTKAECRRAADLIREAVLGEFPFAHCAGSSAALALPLTIIGRRVIRGPVPAFVADASAAGSGKGLLVDSLCTIAIGRKPADAPPPRDNDEMRKRLTAWSGTLEPVVKLDNATTLGWPAMDAVLTSTRWQDRRLGHSEIIDMPWRTVVTATANNAEWSADIVRRVIPIRLHPRVDRPEERTFRRGDLLSWVRDHRRQLYVAALTILRGYLAAGCPDVGVRPLGSYEAWCRIVPSALVWIGLPNPLDVREGLTREDPGRSLLARLLDGLEAAFPQGAEFTVGELIARVTRCGSCSHGPHPGSCPEIPCTCRGYRPDPTHAGLREAIEELTGSRPGELRSISIGKALARYRDRFVGGRCLAGRSVRHTMTYRVTPDPDTQPGATP